MYKCSDNSRLFSHHFVIFCLYNETSTFFNAKIKMKKPIKILLVDDEPDIRQMIQFAFKRTNFIYIEAEDIRSARLQLSSENPDLILLDWMLPDMSGLDWAKQLKNNPLHRDIGIILLTARGGEEDKVRGLDVGADDYITKPFSNKELIARIHAVLRRTAPDVMQTTLEVAGLRLETHHHQAFAFDKAIKLGPTEFRLLWFFMSHSGRTYSRAQLLDKVWGNTVYVEERTVDVHIRRLRRILADSGHDRLLHTVRGEGYCFRHVK